MPARVFSRAAGRHRRLPAIRLVMRRGRMYRRRTALSFFVLGCELLLADYPGRQY